MSVPKSLMQQSIDAYRKRLFAKDTDALDTIQATYLRARHDIIEQIDGLIKDIEENGITRSSDALKLARAERLIKLIETEMRRLGVVASPVITEGQQTAIDAAIKQAQDMYAMQTGQAIDARAVQREWTALPTAQLEDLVGQLSNGSPLKTIFNELADGVADAVTDALREGITQGLNTEIIAKRLAQLSDLGATRALQISRNAIFGANRRAMESVMEANSDVLMGKRRLCAFLPTTCLACLSLHNHVYRLDEVIPWHSSDRCVVLPAVIDSIDIDYGNGEAWLRSQPEKVQRQVFGNERARAAWDNNEVEIADFVQVVPNATWGPSTQTMGTEFALKQAKERGHVATPRPVKSLPPSDGSDLVRVR